MLTPAADAAALAASPRFAAFGPILGLLPDGGAPTLGVLNRIAAARGLTSGGGAPLRFVAADATAGDYEARIHATGEVPMRPGSVHDLFNALAWLAWPASKAAINRLHHAHRGPAGAPRGTARDVLTLFDEDGLVLLVADPALAELLAAFRWRELFVARRADVLRGARFLGFGHALHEKLLAPFRGLTAKVIAVEADAALFDAPVAAQVRHADRLLAARLADPATLASTRSLMPLPVLGVPGWAAENEDPAYYDDAGQFRPGRRT